MTELELAGNGDGRRSWSKSGKRRSTNSSRSNRLAKRTKGESPAAQPKLATKIPYGDIQDSDLDARSDGDGDGNDDGDNDSLGNGVSESLSVFAVRTPCKGNISRIGSGVEQDSLARARSLSSYFEDDYISDEIETESDMDGELPEYNVDDEVWTRRDDDDDVGINDVDVPQSRRTTRHRPLSPMPSQPAYLRKSVSDIAQPTTRPVDRFESDDDLPSSSQPMFIPTSRLDGRGSRAKYGANLPQLELVAQKPESSPQRGSNKENRGNRQVRFGSVRLQDNGDSQQRAQPAAQGCGLVGVQPRRRIRSPSPVTIPSTLIPSNSKDGLRQRRRGASNLSGRSKTVVGAFPSETALHPRQPRARQKRGCKEDKHRQETLTQLKWATLPSHRVKEEHIGSDDDDDDDRKPLLDGVVPASSNGLGFHYAVKPTGTTVIPDSQVSIDVIPETQQDDTLTLVQGISDGNDGLVLPPTRSTFDPSSHCSPTEAKPLPDLLSDSGKKYDTGQSDANAIVVWDSQSQTRDAEDCDAICNRFWSRGSPELGAVIPNSSKPNSPSSGGVDDSISKHHRFDDPAETRAPADNGPLTSRSKQFPVTTDESISSLETPASAVVKESQQSQQSQQIRCLPTRSKRSSSSLSPSGSIQVIVLPSDTVLDSEGDGDFDFSLDDEPAVDFGRDSLGWTAWTALAAGAGSSDGPDQGRTDRLTEISEKPATLENTVTDDEVALEREVTDDGRSSEQEAINRQLQIGEQELGDSQVYNFDSLSYRLPVTTAQQGDGRLVTVAELLPSSIGDDIPFPPLL